MKLVSFVSQVHYKGDIRRSLDGLVACMKLAASLDPSVLRQQGERVGYQ